MSFPPRLPRIGELRYDPQQETQGPGMSMAAAAPFPHSDPHDLPYVLRSAPNPFHAPVASPNFVSNTSCVLQPHECLVEVTRRTTSSMSSNP